MKINGVHHRAIWREAEGAVKIIDQTRLPFSFDIIELSNLDAAAHAISDMQVRGAPLIGATAAYGVALAMAVEPSDAALEAVYRQLLATRPTAVNLRWALDDLRTALAPLAPKNRAEAAFSRAAQICDEDAERNRQIGQHGLAAIEAVAAEKGRVNILTHCNAGWLATVDWGTATAPIYLAHDAGIDLHVWVDETRPRNQGGHLTAWELANHGVPHTVIVDNAGGHLMQQGSVDLCLVGTDRTTAAGDVCNKIGTYLKALAAKDNDVPFYVCLPSPTIDWTLRDGMEIPIEERSAGEVTDLRGLLGDEVVTTRVVNPGSPAANPAFDVTPARLVTGLITERGIAEASTEGLARLFPENAA